MRWLALPVMVLSLSAAGCGGGEEVVTSFGNFPTGDYCGMLLTARVYISGAFLGADKVSQEALDELVRSTPKEIRADVRTLAQGLTAFTEQVGDDPDVFELEAALESLGPEQDAAEKRVDAWHSRLRLVQLARVHFRRVRTNAPLTHDNQRYVKLTHETPSA